MTTGKRAQILRILAGYGQSDMAARLVIAQPTLSKFESSSTSLGRELIENLALALRVGHEYLIFGEPKIQTIVWNPVVPTDNSHVRKIASSIRQLLPDILAENGITTGFFGSFLNGDRFYFLGCEEKGGGDDRLVRKYQMLVFVDAKLVDAFIDTFRNCGIKFWFALGLIPSTTFNNFSEYLIAVGSILEDCDDRCSIQLLIEMLSDINLEVNISEITEATISGDTIKELIYYFTKTLNNNISENLARSLSDFFWHKCVQYSNFKDKILSDEICLEISSIIDMEMKKQD
jgi:transcriptional regulator with XRE-family HTH domain